MLSCGDTFLTGDGDDDNYHLWIIITPPIEGEVVTVCVVTAHSKSERLIVLNKGEHPFIKRESVIAFRYSEIRTVTDIEEMLATRLAKQRQPIDAKILAHIQDAILESDFTPNGVRAYAKTVLNR